jgi:GalNAc-alpha-(1->4)-GalNAc-alpha-(1->3)-diNAcBac-PP-undecaprenol alpha-1,4-N-acetyl-D-galactosaminyltransferase
VEKHIFSLRLSRSKDISIYTRFGYLPMKLALVIASLSSGGAERVMTDMANFWSQLGWDITLLTLSGDEIEDFYHVFPGVRRIKLGLNQPSVGLWDKISINFRRVIALRRAIRQASPEAVISFVDVTNVLTILATRGLGLRVIVSERIDPSVNPCVTKVWRGLRRVLYRFSTCVVVQTKTAESWIKAVCSSNAVVIPNPLRKLPDIDVSRELLVISVGRLERQKGHDLVLKAFAKLRLNFPNWKLVILGEGTERVALESLRDQLGLQEVVHMLGTVNAPEHWMARAGLVVQASRFEGFPNVILEAMGMGAAVISADCPSGPREMIDDGVNGRLVPVNDVDALTQAMIELMGNVDLRRELGKVATLVRDKYEQKAIMNQWNELLRGVMV